MREEEDNKKEDCENKKKKIEDLKKNFEKEENAEFKKKKQNDKLAKMKMDSDWKDISQQRKRKKEGEIKDRE